MIPFGQESLLLGHPGKSLAFFFGGRSGESEDKVALKMMTGSYTTIFWISCLADGGTKSTYGLLAALGFPQVFLEAGSQIGVKFHPYQ